MNSEEISETLKSVLATTTELVASNAQLTQMMSQTNDKLANLEKGMIALNAKADFPRLQYNMLGNSCVIGSIQFNVDKVQLREHMADMQILVWPPKEPEYVLVLPIVALDCIKRNHKIDEYIRECLSHARSEFESTESKLDSDWASWILQTKLYEIESIFNSIALKIASENVIVTVAHNICGVLKCLKQFGNECISIFGITQSTRFEMTFLADPAQISSTVLFDIASSAQLSNDIVMFCPMSSTGELSFLQCVPLLYENIRGQKITARTGSLGLTKGIDLCTGHVCGITGEGDSFHLISTMATGKGFSGAGCLSEDFKFIGLVQAGGVAAAYSYILPSAAIVTYHDHMSRTEEIKAHPHTHPQASNTESTTAVEEYPQAQILAPIPKPAKGHDRSQGTNEKNKKRSARYASADPANPAAPEDTADDVVNYLSRGGHLNTSHHGSLIFALDNYHGNTNLLT